MKPLTSARRLLHRRTATVTAAVRAVALATVPLALVGASALVRTPAAAASPAPVDGAVEPVVKIMPLGDSITMGIGSAALNSYRSDLHDRLVAAGVPVDFVGSSSNGNGTDNDHEGHSGWTIAKISRHVDEWLATYRPDVVLLHIGTNDLRVDAPASAAAQRLSALVGQIRSDLPSAQILVSKITGTRNLPAQQRRTDAYDAAIPAVVAAHGARVHLVDQSTVRGVDLRDGLHPNEFGYRKMAWNYYRALRDVIGGAAWPLTNNPYRATKAYRCILVGRTANGAQIDCSWWYVRTVTSTAGKATTRRRWQTPHVVHGRRTWVSDLGWHS